MRQRIEGEHKANEVVVNNEHTDPAKVATEEALNVFFGSHLTSEINVTKNKMKNKSHFPPLNYY